MTRPLPSARETADRVAALGWRPIVSPLMRVEPTGTPLPPLRAFDGVVVTSERALDAVGAAVAELRAVPVHAVGRRTAGRIGAVATQAPDLRTLAERLEGTRDRLLHVAGDERAGDLAAMLPEAEVVVHVAYRTPPLPLSDEAVECLRRNEVAAVLLFSPRSARLLRDAWPEGVDRAGVEAVAISAAVARAWEGQASGGQASGGQASRGQAWKGRVRVAKTPDAAAVLAALGPFDGRRAP